MKILVTGAAGYIGSVLVEQLLQEGHEVTAFDNLYYKQTTSLFHAVGKPGFRFEYGDVRDTLKLLALAAEHDAIFPLAALVGANLCNQNPEDSKRINTDQIEYLSRLGKKVIYPTTNSGYGVGGVKEVDEESPLKPLSVYGTTKVAAERFLIQDKTGVSFRLATVFGKSYRQRMDLLVNSFVEKAKRDGCIVLFQEHFRRNYIHVKDVCKAFLFAIDHYDKMVGQAYNVGLSSANLTKRELAVKVKEQIPGTVIISSPIGEDPDKRDYLVSNAKLEALGWKPDYTLEDGIREISMVYDLIRGAGDSYRNF